MTIVGTAVAFVLFWSLIAAGLFLAVAGLTGLTRQRGRFHLLSVVMGEEIHSHRAVVLIETALLLAGLMMIYSGGLGTYLIAYR